MSSNDDAAATPGFEVREHARRPDGGLLLKLAGHLDVDGSPRLQAVLAEALKHGVRDVELDCTGLRFMSSVGIGVVIVAVGEFRAVGGDIVVSGLNDELRHVFAMLELTDYVTVR